MAFFFMLGGYCFKTSYLDNFKSFLWKKLISLVLPAYLFRFIVFIIGKYGPWADFTQFIEHYHILGTLWFLTALFKAAVMCWCLLYVLKKLKIANLWFPLILSVLLTYIVSSIGLTKLATTLYITSFYIFGYILKVKYNAVIKLREVSYASVLIANLCFVILLGLHTTMPEDITHATYANFLQYAMISLTGSYLALQVSAYIATKNFMKKIFIIIGQNTMPIVLFQWSAFCVVDILQKEQIILITNNNLLIMDKFFAGIALPMLVYFFYTSVKKKIKN